MALLEKATLEPQRQDALPPVARGIRLHLLFRGWLECMASPTDAALPWAPFMAPSLSAVQRVHPTQTA